MKVDKKSIIDRLEPVTRKQYQDFKTCQLCGRTFWPGSHFEQARKLTNSFLSGKG